jgi:electron transport complex protein RnfC
MSFLTGPMHMHLNGHKDLTDHTEVLKLAEPDVVRIPLINGNAPCAPLVKTGDHVKVGTKIAERNDHFYLPLFSPVSGTVTGIEKMITAGLTPADHLVIENDHKDETERSFAPFDLEKADWQQLLDFVKNAGMLGCGGAGFPTYVKYMKPDGVSLLIINAVECEPFITSDYRMCYTYPDLLKTGAKALLKLSTAEKGCIAIKEDKKDLIEVLKKEFADTPEIEIRTVPDLYPMGWERTLVYQLTGKRYSKFPFEAGCIVNNATTAISLGNAIANGMPITRKIVTVSGDGVAKPQNVEVVVGTSAHDIIEACGGYTGEDVLLIAGGPMMGKTNTGDKFVIGPASNALTVMVNREPYSVKCLRCGRCTEVCPAGLQPVRINMSEKIHDVDALDRLAVNECIECGLCTYVCPSYLNVTEGIRKAKKYLALAHPAKAPAKKG